MEEPGIDTDALQRGEEHAWRQFVRTLTGPLVGYVATILGNQSEAQDVVQQVFVRLFRKRKTLDWDHGSVRGLCFRIARDTALNQRKQNAARLKRESWSQAMQESGETSASERKELAQEAWELAQGLPTVLRDTLLLRFAFGLNRSEIAATLDLAEGTVATHQRKALSELKSKLEKRSTVAAVIALDGLEKSLQDTSTLSSAIHVSPTVISTMEATIMAMVGFKTTKWVIAALLLLFLGVGGALISTDWDSTEALYVAEESNPVLENEREVEKPDQAVIDPGEVDQEPSSDLIPERKPDNDEVVADTTTHQEVADVVDNTVLLATLSGVVVDQEGKPVENAEVSCLSVDSFPNSLDAQPNVQNDHMLNMLRLSDAVADSSPKVYSDVEGKFSLALMVTLDAHPSSESIRSYIIAKHDNYMTGVADWALPVGEHGEGITITLGSRGEGVIRGRVVEASDPGQPAAGAYVILDSGFMMPSPSFKTDQDGWYEITGLPAGHYFLRVMSFDPATTSQVAQYVYRTGGFPDESYARVKLSAGQYAEVQDLHVQRTSDLTFRLSPDKGNLAVVALPLGEKFPIFTVGPDSEGVYSLPNVLKSGSDQIIVYTQGFKLTSFALPEERGRIVDMGELVLEQADSTLRGRVEDTDGGAIADATVVIQTPVGKLRTQSSYDGSFSFSELCTTNGTDIEAVDRLVRYTLNVRKGGFYSAQKKKMTVSQIKQQSEKINAALASGETFIVVMKRANSSVSGTLFVDQSGVDLSASEFVVELHQVFEGKILPFVENGPFMVGTVEADLSYNITSIPPGKYKVRVRYGNRSATSKRLVIGKDTQHVGIDLVIPVGATVSGTVYTSEGNAAAGEKVYLSQGGVNFEPERLVATTDAYGSFVITDVPDGEYRLLCNRDLFNHAQGGLLEESEDNPFGALVKVKDGADVKQDLKLQSQ